MLSEKIHRLEGILVKPSAVREDMIIKYSDVCIRNSKVAVIVNGAWQRAPAQCKACPVISVEIEDYGEEGIFASSVCGDSGEFCRSAIGDCVRKSTEKT